MKPASFEYSFATSIEEAVALVEADEDAKFIAGGQSLIPLLSLRFARPTRLVDITRIPELRSIRRSGDVLVIGALARHVEVERDPLIREFVPLLSSAASWVAHKQIRNRGTFGGSIAHGDSAAEFPAVLLATQSIIVTRSSRGIRRIASADFFGSQFQTALEQGELIVSVEISAADSNSRWGFSEFARRKGDYAIGGAAVNARVDEQGLCTAVAAGLIAAGSGPTRAEGLDEKLVGRSVDRGAIEAAVARVAHSLRPEADAHGSREYRRAVVAESLRRALCQAFDVGVDKQENTA